MGVITSTALVPAHGSGAVPSLVATPPTGSGPGILLLHDLFGRTDHVRRRAERLARLGYVTVVPELFWRLERGVAIDPADDDAVERGRAYLARLDRTVSLDDTVTVFEHLRAMPGVFRRCGVVGFGLGAGLAFGVAAHADPATAVCYYGATVAGQLDRAPDVRCPVLFHWGADDADVPAAARDRVATAFRARPDVETHVHPAAGHSFDESSPPEPAAPAASAEAWGHTEDFLTRTLPVAHH